MTTNHLAGSPPWFARVKQGRRCELRPYARAGWLLTGGYAAVMIALGILLLLRDHPSVVLWISWGAVMVTVTAAYLIIAWRTSEVMEAGAERASAGVIKGCRKHPHSLGRRCTDHWRGPSRSENLTPGKFESRSPNDWDSRRDYSGRFMTSAARCRRGPRRLAQPVFLPGPRSPISRRCRSVRGEI
jgi:hypothetical protein